MSENSSESKESPDGEIIIYDPNFKYEIVKQTGGENLLRCFQCGTCAGICPIFSVDEDYDPQKIIEMALIGLRKEVLSSELIWLCSTCYACYEHCPQHVKITDLMCAIQNIATRDGYLAPALEDKIKLLKEHARTLPMDVFDNKKRSKFDLPSIEEKPEDTAKIIAKTGIEDLVKAAPATAAEAKPAETTEKPPEVQEEDTAEATTKTTEKETNASEKETEGET